MDGGGPARARAPRAVKNGVRRAFESALKRLYYGHSGPSTLYSNYLLVAYRLRAGAWFATGVKLSSSAAR